MGARRASEQGLRAAIQGFRAFRGALDTWTRRTRCGKPLTTRAGATHPVALAPGTYMIPPPQFRRGSGVTRRTVRVLKERFAHDLEIDTGIQ